MVLIKQQTTPFSQFLFFKKAVMFSVPDPMGIFHSTTLPQLRLKMLTSSCGVLLGTSGRARPHRLPRTGPGEVLELGQLISKLSNVP